jgi:hypothetical protein
MSITYPSNEPDNNCEVSRSPSPIEVCGRNKKRAANDNMTQGEKANWLAKFPDGFGFYPDDGRLIRREE